MQRQHRLREGEAVKLRMLALISVMLCATSLSGCASFIVHAGRPLQDVGWRESLQVGESTREEVLSVLGEPVGRGRALLPIDEGDASRTVWTYYYEEATMKDARRLFLFVFLDGELYDGYLWFSSLPGPMPVD
jgi:hypothetical protein